MESITKQQKMREIRNQEETNVNQESDATVVNDEWTMVKKRQASNNSDSTLKPAENDELFQFDESETWANKNSSITLQEEDEVDFFLDSEFEDDEMDSILLVTQHHLPQPHSPSNYQNVPPRRHATQPFIRSKTNSDLADMINEGLYLYEKTVTNTPKKSEKRDPAARVKSSPVTMSPKRFVTGGLTAASPPVGWMVDTQVPFATSIDKSGSLSLSFGGRSQGRSFGAKSMGKSVEHKEFTPFQHPSYELLKENGFVQHKYSKYHDKAIKGIFFYLL
jgi:hypothetical protein